MRRSRLSVVSSRLSPSSSRNHSRIRRSWQTDSRRLVRGFGQILARIVGDYLVGTFHLDPQATGAMPLSADSTGSSGKAPWDSVARGRPEGRAHATVAAGVGPQASIVVGVGQRKYTRSMSPQMIGRPGRNEPCPCGSGRKYKHCCLEKDDGLASVARAAAAAEGAAQSAVAAGSGRRAPKHHTQQPWKTTTSRGFVGRSRTPRKVGGG